MIRSIEDLTAFLKRYHRHWLKDPSLIGKELPGDLPDALATIYRELGALVEINQDRSPFAAQDMLYPLSRLERIEGMFEFACENQGNWTARFPIGDKDPPVFSNASDIWDSEQPGFIKVVDSLNHFLITLCLQEAVMGSRHLVAVTDGTPATRVLSVAVEPVWLDGYYVNGEPDHHVYMSADADVLVMDYSGVWIGSPIHQLSDLVSQGTSINILR